MFKIAAFTTLAFGAACMAQQPGRAKSQLSLTDSQMQNLRSMRDQQNQASRASMDELHTKERALREQLRAGSTDAAALGRMMIDIEAARKRVDGSRQAFRDQALSALSADQKARLKTLEEARKLGPAIREAEMMGLLDPPADGDMMMGLGFGGRRGGGPGGPPPAGGGAMMRRGDRSPQ